MANQLILFTPEKPSLHCSVVEYKIYSISSTMAKGGRKKKEKRKDFQKVKLKVGKKKPQAENFTVTTFKSQAIHIQEQLKSGDGGDEPTTQRKKTIHVCGLIGRLTISIILEGFAG